MRTLFFVVVVVGAVVFGQRWSQANTARAVAELDAEQQRALFNGTWEAFRAACSGTPDGLSDYCRTQASTLRALPQCDEACLRATRAGTPAPTR